MILKNSIKYRELLLGKDKVVWKDANNRRE